MGKASRMKRQDRLAMAGRPGWHQEASRQARERRREQVERHNANLVKAGPHALPFTEEVVALIDSNGQRHVGKKAVGEVYESWVRNEILRDSTAHLDEIASLGPSLHTSIWDVKIEVVDLDDNNTKSLRDPLDATFLMDKQASFQWFLEYAFQSKRGYLILQELFKRMFPMLDAMVEGSVRLRSARLVTRKLVEMWVDMKEDCLTEFLEALPKLSRVAGEILRDVLAQREAQQQRSELERATSDSQPMQARKGWATAL